MADDLAACRNLESASLAPLETLGAKCSVVGTTREYPALEK
jgi:hypothetical protein